MKARKSKVHKRAKSSGLKLLRRKKLTGARRAKRPGRRSRSFDVMSLFDFQKLFRDPRNMFGVAAAVAIVGFFGYMVTHPGASHRKQAQVDTTHFPADFAKSVALSTGDRMAYWGKLLASSETIYGKVMKYGRAPKIGDNVPLLPSKFDCTTYVETVIALSRSQSPEDFYPNLISVRYKNSTPEFANRNHFPEADWLPNNMSSGIISDITASVARASGVEYQTETKEIRKDQWLAQMVKQGKVDRSLASTTEKNWADPINAEVCYIPVGEIDKVIGNIPNGSVINLVRKNNAKFPVLITHQGIITKTGDKIYIRHALEGGTMKASSLSEYMHSLGKQKGWPLLGFNLNEVRE